MNLFNWKRRDKENHDSVDIARLARDIGPIVDGVTKDVFAHYHEILLREEITYVVYAVWGARLDGKITAIQKEINAMVVPVIVSVRGILGFKNMTDEQGYAVDYLVRSLIISKITYTIELARSTHNGAAIEETKNGAAKDLTDEDLSKMLDLYLRQPDLSWRKKFGSAE